MSWHISVHEAASNDVINGQRSHIKGPCALTVGLVRSNQAVLRRPTALL